MRAALIVLALTTIAHATPSDDLDQARKVYRAGQYGVALPLFNALLYPPPPRLASQKDLTDAYLALGVCRFETGDATGAKREFEQALALDSSQSIDPLVVSDYSAIQAFNETKIDMKARADAEADAKHKAELRKIRASLVGVEPHKFSLNFVPFGIGEYQNGDIPKFIAFGTAQTVTLAASAGIWFYLVDTYGIRSTQVPLDDGATVRHLQQVEIGAGVAFFGLWVWSAVDAIRHFEPQTKIELDDSALPPELRGLDKPTEPAKKPPTSLLDRVHLVPVVTPHGGGLGLVWEN